ncbi:MAG TPA: efflux RND transporter periplasmic adaptor subunit [Caproiciproducens sp.]|nr:efflux RND transporter periplasmic adaptor subunit [Caproiciproducens sp.]
MKCKKYIALLLAALLLFCVGCSNGKDSKQAIASVQNTGNKNNIVVWGEVKYNDEYQINIDFPSTVENILVREGDSVTKGSTLLTLSSQDYKKNISKLKSQLDSARAAVGNVDQGALKAEIDTLKDQISTKTAELNEGTNPDLKMLQTSLTQTDKDIGTAKSDLQKYQKLFSSGAISQSDLDKYSDVLDQRVNARSDIEEKIAKTKKALQDELDTLNTNLKYKEVMLNQQKDSVQATAADLDVMDGKAQKAYLSGNNIISNLNHGIVRDISVVKGSVLATQYAPQKVIDLIDADSIYVSAEVPEEFIEQISQNSKVIIIPIANKSLKMEGHVIRIASEAIEKDGDRIVKVQVKPDDKDGILKPGYTADIQFSKTQNKT